MTLAVLCVLRPSQIENTPGFDSAPTARIEGLPIEIFDNRRYLKVERSTTLRKGTKLSKLWNYRTECIWLKALFDKRDVYGVTPKDSTAL
jgi:hypothetical protein